MRRQIFKLSAKYIIKYIWYFYIIYKPDNIYSEYL